MQSLATRCAVSPPDLGSPRLDAGRFGLETSRAFTSWHVQQSVSHSLVAQGGLGTEVAPWAGDGAGGLGGREVAGGTWPAPNGARLTAACRRDEASGRGHISGPARWCLKGCRRAGDRQSFGWKPQIRLISILWHLRCSSPSRFTRASGVATRWWQGRASARSALRGRDPSR